jgi:hypothetical protein
MAAKAVLALDSVGAQRPLQKTKLLFFCKQASRQSDAPPHVVLLQVADGLCLHKENLMSQLSVVQGSPSSQALSLEQDTAHWPTSGYL